MSFPPALLHRSRIAATLLVALVFPAASLAATSMIQETARSAEEGASEEAEQQPEATPPPPGTPPPPRFLTGLESAVGDYVGDVFFWGQSASVTGTLGDNAFLGGQLVSLDGGTLGGDLFAFGASITLDGEVMGDVYAFGSDLRIAPGTTIHGNLLAFTGSLRIGGTVRGHVLGAGGGTVITGNTGPVKIEAGSLTVSETAVIRGDLEYTSNEDADIAEGATIEGNVRRNRESDDEDEGSDEEEDSGGISFWTIAWTTWKYLSALVVGAVLLLVGGPATRRPALSLRENPASGLGFGFVVGVVVPVACLVAMVLLVTLPLGLLTLGTFVILLYLARLVAAQFLGAWILARATGNANPSEYASLALGLALLMLVGAVPYLGFLIRMIAIVLGLGGIYLALRHFGFPAGGGSRPAPSPATPRTD